MDGASVDGASVAAACTGDAGPSDGVAGPEDGAGMAVYGTAAVGTAEIGVGAGVVGADVMCGVDREFTAVIGVGAALSATAGPTIGAVFRSGVIELCEPLICSSCPLLISKGHIGAAGAEPGEAVPRVI